MQNHSDSNPNQSIVFNINGNDVTIGNINQNIGSAKQVEITFDTFVEIISRRYSFLEEVPQHVVKAILKLLRNPTGTKLQDAEVYLLKLVVRYCCFFRNNWRDPEAKRKLDANYYLSSVESFASDAQLVVKRRKLSKIVRDTEMSKILNS